jgi:AraC-like DNA-binding protein
VALESVEWVRTDRRATTVEERRALLLEDPAIREVDVDAPADSSRLRVVRTGTTRLALESRSCGGGIAGVHVSPEEVVVTWLKHGRGWIRGHELPLGQPTLFRADPDTFRWRDFETDSIRISRAAVEAVAAERGGWDVGPLEFDPLWVPQGAPLAAWWVTVRHVADTLLSGPSVVSADRAEQLVRHTAGAVLTAIPHWPVGHPHADPARSRLARAERYLLAHARDPIGIADIAAAAGLSVRGVQQAFRREHGTTPLEFLRRVRLHLVREQLRSGPATTVSATARDHGFVHLGRFAATYREEFGEYPSDTLGSRSD